MAVQSAQVRRVFRHRLKRHALRDQLKESHQAYLDAKAHGKIETVFTAAVVVAEALTMVYAYVDHMEAE